MSSSQSINAVKATGINNLVNKASSKAGTLTDITVVGLPTVDNEIYTTPLSETDIRLKWKWNGTSRLNTRNHYFNKEQPSSLFNNTINSLNLELNLPDVNQSQYGAYKQTVDYYNRYKIVNPNYIYNVDFHIYFLLVLVVIF